MKHIEFEVKILNINILEIKKILTKLGASSVGSFDLRRHVYDFSPVNPNKWMRLRSDGIKTSLTIKEISSDYIDGTKEIEVDVSSFDDTNHILQELGYVSRSYQENKRESYLLDNVQIEIDTWPKIPTYLEIEGDSENEVYSIVKKLGFKKDDTTSINTKKIYKLHNIDLNSIKKLTF